MKRVWSVLLVLALMLGGMLSVPALADGARNYLSATSGGSVSWAEDTTGDARIGTVNAGETIEFGTSYYVISTPAVKLTANPASGYNFKGWYTQWNSTDPALVSTSASYTWTLPTDVGTELTAAFEAASAAPSPITSVTVNVTPPAAGTTVGSAGSAVSIPSGENYSVLGFAYYAEDPSSNVDAIPLPSPAAFPAGTTVYVGITLQANSGYMFQQASPYTAVTVNGATLTGGTILSVTNTWDESTGAASYGNLLASFTIPAATHAVSFDMDGHYGAVPSQTVEDGAAATRPSDPASDANASDYAATGLHFHGWYNKPISQIASYTEFCYTPASGGCIFDFNTPITQDTTVYAAYWGVLELKAYDVTNSQAQTGGTFDLGSYYSAYTSNYSSVQTTAFYGLPEFLTAKPASGYKFAGWSTSTSKDDIVSTDAAYTHTFQQNTTLYALFEVIPSYTVSFSTDGGGAVDAQTVADGSPAVRPADPIKEDFVFDGWFSDAALTAAFDFSAPIAGDTTIYAKWRPAEYVLTSLSGTTADAAHTWRKDSNTPVVITVKLNDGVDNSFAHFTGVQLDGRDLAAAEYTAAQGSTVVTLAPATLQNLSIGSHTVTIVFNNGQVPVTLTVKTPASTSPDTGDRQHTALWLGLAGFSALGLGTLAVSGKKRRSVK